MGVVVRRYIDILIIITFPYSTCISSFLAAASLLLCSFFKCFIIEYYLCSSQLCYSATSVISLNRDLVECFIATLDNTYTTMRK